MSKYYCYRCFGEIDIRRSLCSECGAQTRRSYTIGNLLLGDLESNGSISLLTRKRVRRYAPISSRDVAILSSIYRGSFTPSHDVDDLGYNGKITKVVFKGLFGFLDYDIDMNDHVSIIIGANGFGKTTLFNFISFVLSPSEYKFEQKIKDVPFTSFSVHLDDGTILTLLKDDKCVYLKSNKTDFVSKVTLEKTLFDQDESLYDKTSEDTPEIDHSFKEVIDASGIRANPYFIATNRTSPSFAESDDFDFIDDRAEHVKTIDPVEKCNSDLQVMMKEAKNQYQQRVEKIKNSLPHLYLKEKRFKMDFNEFSSRWRGYCNRVSELVELGLLTASSDLDLVKSIEKKDYEGGKGLFLAIYLDEYERSLEPFNDISKKMVSLMEIVNERNEGTGKSIRFCDKGVQYLFGGKEIALNCLSSGEKNDFIMFFDLIFETKKGSIILIDEPEISLHVSWQERFIDNLSKALEGSDCQVIIATHSPDIISYHDDLLANKNVTNHLPIENGKK